LSEPGRNIFIEWIALMFRDNILRLIRTQKGGHSRKALPSDEILICLYFKLPGIDSAHQVWPQRKHYVLSGFATSAGKPGFDFI